MTTGSTGSLFPKWQLAVLLGAPIAIGIGILYYRKQTSLAQDDDDGKKTNKDKKSIVKGQTISIDGDDNSQSLLPEIPVPKQLSPLEQAAEFKNEGNVCFKKGKYDEAIKLYDKAIETCPTDNSVDLSTYYQNRAAAYEQLKKWSAVKADCTKALELNPRYIKALYRRAKANEYTNDLAASLEDVTATCILEGFQNNSSLTVADRILKQMGKDDTTKAMQTRVPTFPSINFINTYLSSFTQDPIRKMVLASNSNPKGFVRAKIAFDNKDYESVIAACTEEIESSESESEYKNEAKLLRGTFYLLTGSVPEAETDFQSVIGNKEADVGLRVNALIKLASLNFQHENPEKGFEYFAAAEKLDPNNADIYHQRGQVFILLEQVGLASEEFDKAIKLAPDQGLTYIQKCYADYRNAIVQQNQIAISIVMENFKNAIKKFPDCIECYSVLAQIYTEQGAYEEANVYYEKAIKMAPGNASFHVHRGIMQLSWNGDVNTAIDYMRRGIEIDEKCELAYETLGTVEVQRGNLENAVVLFEQAIKLAKSKAEMGHLYALRNAAIAQINVAKKLGIEMSTLSALAAENNV